MAKIFVEGKEYKVIESLGWQASAGMYVKAIETETGRRIVVKPPSGSWSFHRPIVLPPTRYEGM